MGYAPYWESDRAGDCDDQTFDPSHTPKKSARTLQYWKPYNGIMKHVQLRATPLCFESLDGLCRWWLNPSEHWYLPIPTLPTNYLIAASILMLDAQNQGHHLQETGSRLSHTTFQMVRGHPGCDFSSVGCLTRGDNMVMIPYYSPKSDLQDGFQPYDAERTLAISHKHVEILVTPLCTTLFDVGLTTFGAWCICQCHQVSLKNEILEMGFDAVVLNRGYPFQENMLKF